MKHNLFGWGMATKASGSATPAAEDEVSDEDFLAQIEAFTTQFVVLVESGEIDEGLHDLAKTIQARCDLVAGKINVKAAEIKAERKSAKSGSSAAKKDAPLVATHTIVGVPALKGATVTLVTTDADKDGKVQVRLFAAVGERAAGKVLRVPLKVVKEIVTKPESGSAPAVTTATPAKRTPRKQTVSTTKGK